MLQLIQDTLDLTDRDVATREVQNVVVDAEQTLRELVHVLQPLASKRRMALSVHCTESMPEVVSDASKLKQVLYNLLSTSLQQAGGANTLSISMLPAGADSFCIEVRDDGRGLTRPQLAHLNDLNPSEASASALYLTRHTLAAIGGRLETFNDQASGSGVRLELPLRPSSARPYLRSV